MKVTTPVKIGAEFNFSNVVVDRKARRPEVRDKKLRIEPTVTFSNLHHRYENLVLC